MINLSYNISADLKEALNEVESLRAAILLSVISPKIELQIRWETMLDRIFCSLNLAGNTLTKLQMEKIIINPLKTMTTEEKEVIKYKNALDFISQNWLAENKPVSAKTLIAVHDLYSSGKLRSSETDLKEFFNYLQVKPEHPIVQAAVGLVQISAMTPFSHANGITSRLLAYLLLYKYGYDFRKMLVLEKNWQSQPEFFRDNLEKSIEKGNLTLFLEYFTQSVIISLKEQLVLLKTDFGLGKKPAAPASEFLNLDDRQKAILNYLEQPETDITNRKVQKLFKVSQITASRDLAKLVKLGLVFSHGKGRSVYYTKV